MKKNFAVVVALFCVLLLGNYAYGVEGISINDENFPDDNFRAYVSGMFDDGDGVLTEEEIQTAEMMNIPNMEISSLKGIEYFTALRTLYCYNNELKELDLRSNVNLERLSCSSNQITELDLRSNVNLKNLSCGWNELNELDITNCTKLQELSCMYSEIKKLDVSKCPELQKLECQSNQITSLNLSACTLLEELDCSRNPIQVLDVTCCPKLKKLNCVYNEEMTSLNAENCSLLQRIWCYWCNIETLNVRGCSSLVDLDADRNQLEAIDLSSCTSLQKLGLYSNKLKHIDVSNNLSLTKFECPYNNLSELNIASNKALVYLDCERNNLSALDISSNSKLAYLRCNSNNLHELDVSHSLELVYLECTSNPLTGINTLSCPKLAVLFCDSTVDAVINPEVTNRTIALDENNFPDKIFREYISSEFDKNKDNQLTPEERTDFMTRYMEGLSDKGIKSLKGIEHFILIDTLECKKNELEELDLSSCPFIDNLDADDNKLTKLDVRSNTLLHYFYCMNNSIEVLDLSDHLCLTSIFCSDNKLRELNINGCILLDYVNCGNNEIEELDTHSNPLLRSLSCAYNQLTELDLSNNTNLSHLYCWDNQLIMLDVSNTLLTDLGASSNPLREVRARNCEKLKELWCYNGQLESLDVSGCNSMTTLSCYKNKLRHLDVSGNTALEILYCWDNQLTELDVRNCWYLRQLYCSGNSIEELDVSQNIFLEELGCNRNQLRAINVDGNLLLDQLYCYDNQIKTLNLKNNEFLRALSCANNQLMELDLSMNKYLLVLECSGNYLTGLDLSNNTHLLLVDCQYTTLREINVSNNPYLMYLDCSHSGITKLDLSRNTDLVWLYYSGNKNEGLRLTYTEDRNYPYKTDIKEYAGESLDRVLNVCAFTRTGESIDIVFDSSDGTVNFASSPVYITYDYDTGFEGYDPDSPDIKLGIMNIRVGLPTRSFIYLPRVEPNANTVGVDESEHDPHVETKIDRDTGEVTTTVTYAAHYVGHSSLYDITNENSNFDSPDDDTVTPDPEPESKDVPVNPEPSKPVSSSNSGGCNSGFGILFAIFVLVLMLGFRYDMKGMMIIFVLVLSVSSCSFAEESSHENVYANDYTLPMPLEAYIPAGTWTTDFEFTPELAEIIAGFRKVSADRVHSYADIALSESWEIRPIDIYNLARNGEYGGVILPLSESGTSNDIYVVLCVFSSDVEPGEEISVHGFPVSTDTFETVYDMSKRDNLATWVTLDENYNRVERVPNNRRIYLAVSYSPEYINTGVLTVIRGDYIEEEDPLIRLDPDVAQRIAEDLGIGVNELKYLSRAHRGPSREATDAMKEEIQKDHHQIIADLFTLSADEPGHYYFTYTLPDELWEVVKGQKMSDYKFYNLNDSEDQSASSGNVEGASILFGLLNAYELTGGKLDIFSVKTFILAGFLQAGTPFSVYLAKMLLLLLAGCNTGLTPSLISVLILGMIIIRSRKR